MPVAGGRARNLAARVVWQVRASHWIKNGIIILPAFFAGRMFRLEPAQAAQLLLTFLGFSLTASCIYILNDVLDVDADRAHPAKRLRPLAAGYFGTRQAALIAAPCLVGGVLCALALPRQAGLAMGGYLTLNLLYCFWLKHMPVTDVACIAAGFVLRLMAGGLVAGVALSHWIVIITFLLMFSVALAKRRDDLVLSTGSEVAFRSAQAGYTRQFIDTAKSISFAVTLVAYILYTVSPEVMARLGSTQVYITALPVFLGIMRYLQLSIVKESTGDPVRLLFRDPFLIVMVLSWLSIFYWMIYA